MTEAGDSNDVTADIEKSDELWRQAESCTFQEEEEGDNKVDHAAVYNCLKELDAKHPDSVQIKWRLARACKDMSETTESNLSTFVRKQYAYEGRDVARAAVQLVEDNDNDDSSSTTSSNCWQAHMFLGALLGVCSRFELLHKLSSAREMKECFQRACDIAGDASPEPHHALGSAEYGFAEAGRAARLLGLKGTYERARELFEKAESLCPHDCYDNQGGHYKRNWLMMVKALKALGRTEEAGEWLEKLLRAEAVTPDDRQALAEAQQIKL